MAASSKDRYILFPSRANLSYVTSKILSTGRGQKLLKQKKDSLLIRQREIIIDIRNERGELPTIMKNAIYSFNRAKFLAVDINSIGLYGSPNSDIHVKVLFNTIVGITVPTFDVEIAEESSSISYPLVGLGKGGQQILDIRNRFQKVTVILIQISAKMYANKSLYNAIKQVNKRINAIENIIIPKLIATKKYILGELDEYEREEFTRLKKAKHQKAKNLLYAENVKTDESLNIKRVLTSFIDPEEFVELRRSLNPQHRQTLRSIVNKNTALEKIIRY